MVAYGKRACEVVRKMCREFISWTQVLEVITRGNESMIEKWKESDKIMCEIMIKIMANELEESKRKGIEHGEHLLADTIIKLRAGDSRKKLLEEGITEETINLALTLL